MAEYDKSEKKIKYDKELVLAKLKQLENKAELNRANMVSLFLVRNCSNAGKKYFEQKNKN